MSSSQTGVSKEIINPEVITISSTEGTKPPEKKMQHPPAKSYIVPSAHHRSSHPVERHGQPSSSSGALDLQAVVGQSRSSISGITVPIRLDALSYLLNNAITGACKTPAQMPCPPQTYPPYPYPQMGWPCYSACMNSQYCSLPFPNQFSACQPGYMPCGNQPGVPAFQQQVPSYSQTMASTTQNEVKSPLLNFPSQSGGMACSSNVTNLAQDNNESSQSDANRWAKKPNDRFGTNMSNSFSSESQQQNSPSRRGFGRFGDKQNEDNWSGRQQSSFRRGFGRGRGDFAGQSRQGNSRGQDKDWQFGDRSRNSDFGGQKRFSESPERGNFFKRGRWPGGRGGGGDSRDTWQQRNRQDDSSNWANTTASKETFSSGGEAKMTNKSNGAAAEDENWETDYPEQAANSKLDDSTGKCLLSVSSPSLFSPKSDPTRQSSESSETLKPELNSVDDKDKSDKPKGGFALEVSREKEEGETYSSSEKVDVEALDPEPEVGGQDSTTSPVVPLTERMEAVEATNGSVGEDVCSFVISVDGDNTKGILVEVNAESQ
ncbi:lens fiber membrane intrinsic protein isoform X2 [Pseudophryne corroboree]